MNWTKFGKFVEAFSEFQPNVTIGLGAYCSVLVEWRPVENCRVVGATTLMAIEIDEFAGDRIREEMKASYKCS